MAARTGVEPFGPQGLGWLAFAWAAQNLVNTFDHADGFVCALAGVALPPLLAAPFLGLVPHNLLLRRQGLAGASLARLYLGDSGAHLAGLLMLAVPDARWLLVLPAFDLARVAVLRVRAHQAPWLGDRRHLGHRFLASGYEPKIGALAVVGLALPLAMIPERGPAFGLSLALVAFVGAIYLTQPAGPCSDPGAPR
ncbi:MAG: hypothetical protein R3F33_16560 [Planctomycetota bacterium]